MKLWMGCLPLEAVDAGEVVGLRPNKVDRGGPCLQGLSMEFGRLVFQKLLCSKKSHLVLVG